MRLLPALLLILPATFLCVSSDVQPLLFVAAPHVKNGTTIRKVGPEMRGCNGTRPPSEDNVHKMIVKQDRNAVCLRSFQ